MAGTKRTTMKMFLCLLLVGFAFATGDYTEEAAVKFAKEQNELRGQLANMNTLVSWNYESNLTEHNKKIMLDTALETSIKVKKYWEETIKFPWQTFKDADLRRQFKQLSLLGTAALSDEKKKELNKLISDMGETYSKAKVCDYKDRTKCDLSLEPELLHVMATSRDPEELKYYWTEWREVSGKQYKDKYQKMVTLLNEAAVLNNFTDAAEYWKLDFESETFDKDLEDLLKQLDPLYKQLHAYVRRKLYLKYGEEVVSKKGPIPVHLLGNMWAQDWSNVFDILDPFPSSEEKKQTEDPVTLEMRKQNYTALKMFKLAEQFFTSLNLSAMPETFWEKSIIEKPKGVELTCHASAWDFYDGKDFRIKQCTTVDKHQFLVVHHEMGHIQYFLQYKDQPYVYREGANSGFHEAIGDIMSLSVGTEKHLAKLGLLKLEEESKESMVKSLMTVALAKFAFLPFGYLIDQYRWDIFKGKVKPENYNCAWWDMRVKYQGVEPPVQRNEEQFDAGAKYHVASNVPYVRYFVSHVLQFQFQESLCKAAGEFDLKDAAKQYLHQCDIYKSTAAGNLLGKMLRLGSSKPWPEALELVTGTKKMDASSVLNYFKPLYDWLVEENKKTDEYVGWQTPEKGVCAAV
ncbi:angiotensin-converting enzyme-like [Cimex lectularius]|uniref:Angiotensin-converting enzyme n=1 Tax=Cimex lectularius TaxID=79782 RepID=A0A8I6S7C1_CIMLE|nr:angiotensin-converting enzyme-like [Cimex lectularius]